ncbi:hypothetical protein [Agaribacterium haliotis]|uniref:hypothetical protein n=1 Tax=Agaribacterium haliotis TaxID=2013869 RepID=UPI001178C766|nr:hypothetical protein [Agaribacterium haliotis]
MTGLKLILGVAMILIAAIVLATIGLATIVRAEPPALHASETTGKQRLSAEDHRNVKLTIAINSVSARKLGLNSFNNVCEQLDQKLSLKPLFDRAGVELLLICRALAAAGINADIKLVEAPNYWRALKMLESGKVTSIAESIWNTDAKAEFVYRSEAVLRLGEFEKGIYTTAKHPLQNTATTEQQLRQFTGVTMKTWDHDWRILNELSPHTISTIRYESIVKMLEVGRGDFTLHAFPNKQDLSLDVAGLELRPLRGVKIVIPESRVLVVSRKAPQARTIADALNKGIILLRSRGEIRPLYEQHGFINANTRDWQVLNTVPKGLGPSALLEAIE